MSNVLIDVEPFDKSRHPANLPKFDNVKLAAVAMCPTFGIMRYDHHKVYKANRRQMPLVAGVCAHEAFAAVRLGDLYFNGDQFYDSINTRTVAVERAVHLFGAERTEHWVRTITQGEDVERSIMLGALDIFESSGFYDDPDDKRRTIANIEETIIAYVSRYPIGKIMTVVTRDALRRPFVGVEVGMDMFLRIRMGTDVLREYHFVGRIDGVMWPNVRKTHITIEDDKTASRLNEAWHEAWKIAHQPTGYCIGASALLNANINRGVIRGASIPLPKTYDYGGIASVPYTRTPLQFQEWAEHVVHIMDIVDRYHNKPLGAPRYTTSCNKYFRPCAYIPFCDSDMEERAAMYNEMDNEVWDPLSGEHYEDEEYDS